ncbi:hypothetical protein C1645_835083 [Glomus cerebriforme]|uniref:HTH myb-type domain-containing protein n=1 Tax=Glomus cerebriforme TaxID=658196 RepID=A0A397SII6_9GLOM|nr:hypothetical protein C1645_835083 [Glomus cerebriforme]
MALFSEKDERLIISHMKSLGHYHDRFVRISRLMPKYTPKQISNHWRNYLNPKLCKKPLGNYEKKYIIELAQKYKKSRNQKSNINWKNVIQDLEKQFGKLYSENQVKNFWGSNIRSNTRIDLSLRLPEVISDDDPKHRQKFSRVSLLTMEPTHQPVLNEPYKMQPY